MPLILLYGDNRLEIDEALHLTRTQFNPADVMTFEGAIAPLPAIAEACLTAGLFATERLVIVHDLHTRNKGARGPNPEWDDIRSLLGNAAPTTTLLLVSPDVPADHALIEAVTSAGGSIRRLGVPSKADLPRWILARVSKSPAGDGEARMSRDAAELLADLVGADTVLLANEIEKLTTYAGSEPITPEMVDSLVGAVTQESVFALVDAVAAGNHAAAFRLLHAQLQSATSSPIEVALYLIRMLTRQMRILLRIHLGQQTGRSQAQIVADLKLPRYFADRYFKQARRLSRDRLMNSFEQLAEFEFALKSGRADPAAGLDLLLGSLCA